MNEALLAILLLIAVLLTGCLNLKPGELVHEQQLWRCLPLIDQHDVAEALGQSKERRTVRNFTCVTY